MKTIDEITRTDRQTPSESFGPIDIPGTAVSPVCDETFIDRWLLCCNRQIPAAELFGRAALWAVLLVWGLMMITGPIEKGWCTFLHNIDLPIHETGHLVFLLFGRYMHFLGGSIFQILLPAIFAVAFVIYKRDAFAAAVMFWWTGQNFLDVASYINDARAMSANLVGGNIHDWNWLLGHMGRLHQDRQIAAAVFAIGAVIMILSVIWSGWILWLQTESRVHAGKVRY
jgi:hypothetical protein